MTNRAMTNDEKIALDLLIRSLIGDRTAFDLIRDRATNQLEERLFDRIRRHRAGRSGSVTFDFGPDADRYLEAVLREPTTTQGLLYSLIEYGLTQSAQVASLQDKVDRMEDELMEAAGRAAGFEEHLMAYELREAAATDPRASADEPSEGSEQ